MGHIKMRTLVIAVGMALAAPAAFAAGVATASIDSAQFSAGMINHGNGTSNKATVKNHVLQNVAGNVGANIAAGSGNMQGNNASIATAAGSLTPTTDAGAGIASIQVGNALSLNKVKDETNNASARNHVLQNASGNVGLNIAAGSDNMQANNMALAEGQGEKPGGYADTSVSSFQLSGPLNLGLSQDNNDTASVRDHVLQNASGNIGVNVAAGEQNMGVNNLAVAYDRGGVDASAAVMSIQAALLVGAMTRNADNDASLQNDVLQNASGNIGVNVAAGMQNMQANSLAVSTARAVYPYAPSNTAGTGSVTVTNVQEGGIISGAFNADADNDAVVKNRVLQNASGNIGVNVAAGVQNMQTNNSAIALVDTTMSHGVADTTIANTQGSGPIGLSLTVSGDNDAIMKNDVLQNASGNIGVNIAAGTENMQGNNLGYAYNNAGTAANATIDNDQKGVKGFDGNRARLSATVESSDYATLKNHVLQNASGNIGVNVAAGEFNGQANNLAIAAAAGAVDSQTSSSATINDNQDSNLALTYTEDKKVHRLPSVAVDVGGDMSAALTNDVLQNASGNIGVNVASGVQNLQANNTAIALGWGTELGGPATASITGTQQSGPWSFALNKGATNKAVVRDNVLQNASGKIGANVAAGVQNMQSNDLAYAFDRGGSGANAFTEVSQVSLGAITSGVPLKGYCSTIPVSNTAVVSNNVMQNTAGDIGLNVAAGAANLQRNTLTISDAD